MLIIFVVEEPLKYASIMTIILPRVDMTYNMLTYYNTYCTKDKRGMSVGSVYTFISAHGFSDVTCPLDPGFDAIYLVIVQWRQ